MKMTDDTPILCSTQTNDSILPPAMYNGSSSEESYSHVSTYTTGSYYEQIKESVMNCFNNVLEKRIQEGCGIVSIADFGTADGVNFLHLLRDIMVDEFKTDDAKVFFVASGRSMYTQCVPSGLVDLVVSSTATHWLSTIPCQISNGLACVHGLEGERKMFQEQAKIDWKNFLLCRGLEMKIGGFMVVLVLVMETEEHGRVLYRCISEAWRELYKNGKINIDEFQKTTLGLYTERTELELRSAFEDPDINKTGLKLVSIRDCIHYQRPLINLRQQKDKLAYANAIVNFIRPWVRNVIFYGLSEARLPAEKEKILEEYFEILVGMAHEDKLKIEYLLNKEIIARKM